MVPANCLPSSVGTHATWLSPLQAHGIEHYVETVFFCGRLPFKVVFFYCFFKVGQKCWGGSSLNRLDNIGDMCLGRRRNISSHCVTQNALSSISISLEISVSLPEVPSQISTTRDVCVCVCCLLYTSDAADDC